MATWGSVPSSTDEQAFAALVVVFGVVFVDFGVDFEVVVDGGGGGVVVTGGGGGGGVVVLLDVLVGAEVVGSGFICAAMLAVSCRLKLPVSHTAKPSTNAAARPITRETVSDFALDLCRPTISEDHHFRGGDCFQPFGGWPSVRLRIGHGKVTNEWSSTQINSA
ncbi:hypothetical protein GCM10017786_72330 [Amycolatopsis deserti]|uniref:Uncharacterized protein n=1 Tax=Amycolatopsis deserti TaxID=185696 RepID=A0ABQ3JJ26_9PSEU|nr:hypothetical protein GCM10017786_72330 [Amycolatopsis deserti]